MRKIHGRSVLCVSLILLFTILACGQTNKAGHSDHKTQPAGHLPPPFATPSSTNPPKVVPRPEGAQLKVPAGFNVAEYASDFNRPRWLALAPNGDLFVAEERGNQISILRDTNHDGQIESRFVFATGLNRPFGMAFHSNYLYVGNTDSIVRFRYKPGQTKAEGAPEKLIDLPTGGHWTRNLIFSPDGKKMYVAVGSKSNVDVEDEMRAAIHEYNPDGTGHRVFASGLRNPVGLNYYPGTNTLWTTVNERDGLGDDLVPDYVTSVKDGGFYGWPYYYLGANEDPRRKGEAPQLASKVIVPDVLVGSHTAALGLIFYTGKQFPADYRGDAFVALHGSWNRAERVGYNVLRLRFKNGKPVGQPEVFLSGWLLDPGSKDVWGRPVGLLQTPDGSLLVVDDGANKIWRVTYQKRR